MLIILNKCYRPAPSLLFSCCRVQLFAAPWTAARQAPLSFTILQSFLKLMSIESMMPSHHLILCYPLLLLPSVFPNIGVFSNELALCIRWPKYWRFSFSISLSNEYSGLISFRIGWFDLPSVKELSGLLQHHITKASIFWHSDFCMVQPSHSYLTPGKTTFDCTDLRQIYSWSLCFFKTLELQDLEMWFEGPETNASSAAVPDHTWKSWERVLSCGERSMLLLNFHEIISWAD